MSERVLLPSSVLPGHYSLTLTPDLETLTFTGILDIEVNVSEPTTEITLHAKELQIKSATFKSTGEALKLVGLNYSFTATTVTLVFSATLPLGAAVLSIEYTGILNGDMAGFYRSSYSDAAGVKKIMASTQFEALVSHMAE